MRYNDLIGIPTDKFKSMIDTASNITAGRGINVNEEIDYRTEVKLFNNTLKKLGHRRIVAPELMPTVEMFEKAEYDFNKLPKDVIGKLSYTYKNIAPIVKSDKAKYSGTSLELYCSIYEMFSGNAISNAVKRIKKSKFARDHVLSREMYTSIESFQNYLSENEQSEEWVFAEIASGVAATSKTITAIGQMIHILTILLVFLIVGVVILCLVSASFNANISEHIIREETSKNVKSFGATKAHEINVLAAMEDSESNFPPATKLLFFKPMNFIQSFINKLVVTNYKDFDNSLTKLDNYKSKEDFEQSEEAVLLGFLGWKAAAIASVLLMPIILCSCRHVIYYVSHCRLKLHEFLKEQAEWTEFNIENLIEKRDNPTTPEAERERINKIIIKQEAWVSRLNKLSESIYKTQLSASNDTRTDLRDDDSKTGEIEMETNKEMEEGKDNPNTDVDTNKTPKKDDPSPNKPIVIF